MVPSTFSRGAGHAITAVGTEKSLPVKIGHNRHKQLFAVVTSFVNLFQRHRFGLQFEPVGLSQFLKLLRDVVRLVTENHGQGTILRQKPVFGNPAQVTSFPIMDQHPDVGVLKGPGGRARHRGPEYSLRLFNSQG